eukprot:2521735-Rhodomonas_salina.1
MSGTGRDIMLLPGGEEGGGSEGARENACDSVFLAEKIRCLTLVLTWVVPARNKEVDGRERGRGGEKERGAEVDGNACSRIPPIALRTCYAMSGTDIGYAATRLQCQNKRQHWVQLRWARLSAYDRAEDSSVLV